MESIQREHKTIKKKLNLSSLALNEKHTLFNRKRENKKIMKELKEFHDELDQNSWKISKNKKTLFFF
jgi:hypothetical protein